MTHAAAFTRADGSFYSKLLFEIVFRFTIGPALLTFARLPNGHAFPVAYSSIRCRITVFCHSRASLAAAAAAAAANLAAAAADPRVVALRWAGLRWVDPVVDRWEDRVENPWVGRRWADPAAQEARWAGPAAQEAQCAGHTDL